jgi:multicomponent Na+:H+ antiporter subunit E
LSMGRGVFKFALVVVLLTAVWCVWIESLTLSTIVTGLILSTLALTATNRFLLKAQYQEVFSIHPLTIARYVAVLLVEIFKSGVHAIHITLTGRINVGVVDLPSKITDPFRGVLVANAITLTPGTVTIDHKQGTFKVIWIECLTTDPDEAAEMIKGSFERVFEPRGTRQRAFGETDA